MAIGMAAAMAGVSLVVDATDGGKGGLRDPTDGSWHGAGQFPEETMKYYQWIFKGEKVALSPPQLCKCRRCWCVGRHCRARGGGHDAGAEHAHLL